MVDRAVVEVSEWKVNEALPVEALTIKIPEGGKVYDWRFDPPAEYEYLERRSEEEIRALAEDAKRKRDLETAPFRDMVAQIEKRVGQEAPELPRTAWFNGGPLKLGDLRGKVLVLHFWATWCGPCHDEIRSLVASSRTSSSDPLVIGVHDAEADLEAVKKAIAEQGIQYPVCIDTRRDAEGGRSQRSWYRIRGLPYTILIDTKGRVAAHGALRDMLEKARGMR